MNEITSEDLKKLLASNKNAILVDCRASKKYEIEHIQGAVSLPLDSVEEQHSNVISDKNALIITSCSHYMCLTSINCYKKLKKLGYKNLFEYAGGLIDWKANGFGTVKGK